MGVHGLTAFVKRSSSLANTVHLTAHDSTEPRTPLVVDGLAFLYQTGMDDPIPGGNYASFGRLVRRYIEYWRAVGLEPVFVFDGPYDITKLPTALQRAEQALNKAIFYFRLSDEARANPSQGRRVAKLPILSLSTCVEELQSLAVVVHLAEGEADSPTAELAQRLRGYMTSNDSDYFIFPSACLGYAPLSEIEYGATGSNYLPHPFATDPPSLRLRVYQHTSLARLLELPPSFLPIFAALLGNDLVDYARILDSDVSSTYTGQVTPSTVRRIGRTLATLKEMPADTSEQRRSVLNRVVSLLVDTPPPNLEEMIINLSAATESYVLSPLGALSPSFPLSPRSSDSPSIAHHRHLYSLAFNHGRIGSVILQFLKHGIFAPRGALEDPEYRSTAISVGRPVREWIWCIVGEALGVEWRTVREFVRKGERLCEDTVEIETFEKLMNATGSTGLSPKPPSVLLAPISYRLQILYTMFSFPSYTSSPLSDPFLPLLLSLRHLQTTLKRPWTAHELRSSLLVATLISGPISSDRSFVPSKAHIQRSAELIQALFHVSVAVEALLLTSEVVKCHRMFEGRNFHVMMRLREDELERLIAGLGEKGELVERLFQVLCS